jgi:hypothetical protein
MNNKELGIKSLMHRGVFYLCIGHTAALEFWGVEPHNCSMGPLGKYFKQATNIVA